jgi:hypothetical protein
MTATENALAMLQPAVYIGFFAENALLIERSSDVVCWSRRAEILFAIEPKSDRAEPRLESAG